MKGYESYSPTDVKWLGDIPASWKCKKIGSLFSERKTKVSDKDFVPLSVAKIGVVPQLETAVKSDAGDNRKLVRAGDFVINSRSDRKGSCGVSELDGSVSLINIVLEPRQEWNGRYVHYLMRSHIFSEEYYRYGRGIVADLWTTRYSEMKNILLPIPPRSEQEQIVRYLDWQVSKINKLIAAKKKEIALLREQRQMEIDKAVLGSCMRDADMPRGLSLADGWSIVKFNGYFTFNKGLSITKKDLRNEGAEVISYGQVHSKLNTGTEIDDSLIRYVEDVYLDTSPNALVQKGDFIFADTSEDFEGVGNCVFVDRDDTIFAGYHTLVARPKDGKANRYLAYLFKSSFWRYQLRKSVNGVKVYSITQRILKNAFVLLPPEDVQKSIVIHLDNRCRIITEAVDKVTDEINILEELKKKLISDVVTGQIDVRGIEVPDFEYEEDINGISAEDENTEEISDDAE
jgi:type I restriction enzyme S subunit